MTPEEKRNSTRDGKNKAERGAGEGENKRVDTCVAQHLRTCVWIRA